MVAESRPAAHCALTRVGRHGHTRRHADACTPAQARTRSASRSRCNGSSSCPNPGRLDECHQPQGRSAQQHRSSNGEHRYDCSTCSNTPDRTGNLTPKSWEEGIEKGEVRDYRAAVHLLMQAAVRPRFSRRKRQQDRPRRPVSGLLCDGVPMR